MRGRRLIATACVGVAAIGGGAAALADTSATSARLLSIAEGSAARAHEPHPCDIAYVATTRAEADRLAGGDINGGYSPDAQTYVIAMRGWFTPVVPVPSGAREPTGGVITLEIDAASWQETDFGVGSVYPHLASAGTVVQLRDGCHDGVIQGHDIQCPGDPFAVHGAYRCDANGGTVSAVDARGRRVASKRTRAGLCRFSGTHWVARGSGGCGGFEFHVPPGRYTVYARPGPCGHSSFAVSDVDVAPRRVTTVSVACTEY